MSELKNYEANQIYSAFDSFIAVETWHTGSTYDDERFYVALNKVIDRPEFSPEKMGDYLRRRKNIPVDDHESAFAVAINRRVDAAWAVKDFLSYARKS